MRNLLSSWTKKSVFLLGMSLAATGFASAQAITVGQRGAEITPFVTSTLVSPDWGQTRNLGFTAGVDYTRFIRAIVQPSLELRMTNATGKNVDERTYLGGFKVEAAIHNIHPYATLLAGTGGIIFHNPIDTYTSDTSFVYSMGGGVEFNVTQSWKVRLDMTQQHWDLDPQILTPSIYSLGVAYSIPFHSNGGWVH
jgi:opacity protein-like surface antigen